MKKSFLLLCILILASTTVVNAQKRFSWGVKAGINVSTVEPTFKDVSSIGYKPGFTGGAIVEYMTNDWLSVSAEVLYSDQGASFQTLLGSVDLNTGFINVPIMANFYVARGFAVGVGLQPSFNIFQNSRDNAGNTTSIDLFRKFDIGMPVGLSYTFDFGLVADLRYTVGLIETARSYSTVPYFSDTKALYNSVLSLTLGWKF